MEKIQNMGDVLPVNIPIQILSVTDTTGRMSPVRFRFEAQDHALVTVQVENVVARDEKNYVGIREKQFICTARVENCRRTMELRYNVESQQWRIFRCLS